MKNNILIIILVIIIGGVAYSYLGQSDTSTSLLASDARTSDSEEARYIYNLARKIEQISLDDSILQDPVFRSLIDNTVSFPQQASGRNNPFAPVGTDGQTSQTSTTSSSVGR